MKETCENCRFQVESECHRYPSAIVRGSDEYWCGEWKYDVIPPEARSEPSVTMTMHFDPGSECLDKTPEDYEKCVQCGGQLLFSARAIGDGYCHGCGHKALAKQKVDREAVVKELREVIRFALDKCRSRTAGNLVDPFAYLYQQDWDDFVGMALKAGVFVQKDEVSH